MRFGIIGAPVTGSMSPRLFRAAYGGKYAYDLIEEDDFDKAWARFLAGYDGINVTAPFKAAAAAAGDVQSPEVARIGAANLAIKTPQGVKVFNTDYAGVLRALAPALSARCRTGITEHSAIPRPGTSLVIPRPEAESISCCGKRAVIVGCGGAGRAAAAAAADLGLGVTLVNRTLDKAMAMAADEALWRKIPDQAGNDLAFALNDERGGARDDERSVKVLPLARLREAVREADVVIYTIPFAVPELEAVSRDDWKGRIVLEANYKTPVLTGCGATYVSGRSWLLHQADAGYSIFTGEKPDFSAMLAETEK